MTIDTFEYGGKVYDITWDDDNELIRHGGPFDRGSADSYYGRGIDPHYYVGSTMFTDRVERSEMTVGQLEEYLAGYEYNERYGDKKEW